MTERAIRKRLQKFPVIPSEHGLWIIDQHINDRGVGVDTVLAENAVAIDQIVKARLLDAAKELTGLDNQRALRSSSPGLRRSLALRWRASTKDDR